MAKWKYFPISQCERTCNDFPGASRWSEVIAPPHCAVDVDEAPRRRSSRRRWYRLAALAMMVMGFTVALGLVVFAM